MLQQTALNCTAIVWYTKWSISYLYTKRHTERLLKSLQSPREIVQINFADKHKLH